MTDDIVNEMKTVNFLLTFVQALCMIISVIVLQTPERTATERGSYGSLFPYEGKL
jgi:hypothetical protein